MDLTDAQLRALKEWAQKDKIQCRVLEKYGIERLKEVVQKGFPNVWRTILEARDVPAPEEATLEAQAVEYGSNQTAEREAEKRVPKRKLTGKRIAKQNAETRKRVRAAPPENDGVEEAAPPSKEIERKRQNAVRLAERRNKMRTWANSSAKNAEKTERAVRFADASAPLQTGVVEDRPAPMWHEQLMKRAFNGKATHRIATRSMSLNQLAVSLSTSAPP
jgi:hypothetical protein